VCGRTQNTDSLVGAIQSQRATDSPCTLNLGRGGEGSANFGFYQVHWWNCECLAAHGTIYRHGVPANDQRPQIALFTHGYHIVKSHSKGKTRHGWHRGGSDRATTTVGGISPTTHGWVRGMVPRPKLSLRDRLLHQITWAHPVQKCLRSLSTFFRYLHCFDLQRFTNPTTYHPHFLMILVKNRVTSLNKFVPQTTVFCVCYRVHGSILYRFSDLVLSNRLHFLGAIHFWIQFSDLPNLLLTAQLHTYLSPISI
jgi:hypothetical protein